MVDTTPILDIRDLTVKFRSGGQLLPAVDRCSFSIGKGEVLGLVGESGSGKSTTAMAMLGLLPKNAVIEGDAHFGGANILTLPETELTALRGRRISMIFQDPMSSLNPVLTVGEQVAEPLVAHYGLPPMEAQTRALELLDRVKIPDARRRLHSYPNELSGGLRQRVMIAMALACEPELLLADEPTTALDVTVQAQILDLLLDLRDESGLSILLITHDLGVVANFADQVAVMYCGRLMETAPVNTFFDSPSHPYTEALIRSIPTDNGAPRLETIPGSVPKLTDLPPGCPFSTRCQHHFTACDETVPVLREIAPSHFSACVRTPDYA
ncbi:ABC transporter ATP-binding protein [uncultured Parasphingorhabdus sp.]|uniref:ABC transporter ATP-binding protein n=1 Tax=uncultured Parasphingorhabdus sp. TaxID=2709694 RepID=UPI002AA94806|nr:ABC transporter ATP-binding protein [uncultured Parasphingorhabdus sp.]